MRVPELPTSRDYQRGVASIDELVRREPTVVDGLALHERGLGSMRGAREYLLQAQAIGTLLEPRDKVLGIDDQRLTTRAWRQGSVAGLLVAREVHGEAVDAIDMMTKFGVKEASGGSEGDMEHAKHLLAQEVIDMAETGLPRLGDEAFAIVEEWEDEVVPEIVHRPMFRRGVGMAALLAYEAHEDKWRTSVVRQAEMFDWDEGLAELLGGDSGGG